MANLKSVACDPSCGFMVQSYDEKEILDAVKMHGKNAHKLNMTDRDIRPMMKSV